MKNTKQNLIDSEFFEEVSGLSPELISFLKENFKSNFEIQIEYVD